VHSCCAIPILPQYGCLATPSISAAERMCSRLPDIAEKHSVVIETMPQLYKPQSHGQETNDYNRHASLVLQSIFIVYSLWMLHKYLQMVLARFSTVYVWTLELSKVFPLVYCLRNSTSICKW